MSKFSLEWWIALFVGGFWGWYMGKLLYYSIKQYIKEGE